METIEWNPGKLLEISGSYWKSCTLQAGVKLGIFTLIGDRPRTDQEIAEGLGGDLRGVTMLLNALSALGLLSKKENTYANTDTGKTFLNEDSPQYLGYILMHHHHLMESWSKLDQGVLTGRPTRSRSGFNEAVVRESFLMGMFNMAMNLAPRIVPEIDLSGRKHLLDLGGGPGTYAIHFCLKNPGLRATVYDLPATRAFAEKTITRFALSDRIEFQEGDYLEGTIQGTFDVVWLSHILHGEGPEDCQRMIGKAVSRLTSGGLILIHEFILNDEMDGPVFPAIFSLNMLLGTEEGQSYSDRQIREFLAQAGVRELRRIPVQTPNDSGIIQGRVG